MKSLPLWAVCASLVLIIASAACGDDNLDQRKSACQKALDAAPFQFKNDQANAASSIKQCDPKWQIQMTGGADSAKATFKFVCTDHQILTLEGHGQSVFRIADNTLYFAHFSSTKTGCAVAAYNLDNGKQVWRTELVGLGPISHEQYRNRVMIDLEKDDKQEGIVRLTGNETGGDYVEVLDQKTGKQLAQRVYRRSA